MTYLILTPAVVTANPRVYFVILLAIVPIYLFVALRTVYQQRLGWTIVKTAALWVGFLALLFVWVLLIAVTGLRR